MQKEIQKTWVLYTHVLFFELSNDKVNNLLNYFDKKRYENPLPLVFRSKVKFSNFKSKYKKDIILINKVMEVSSVNQVKYF